MLLNEGDAAEASREEDRGRLLVLFFLEEMPAGSALPGALLH